VGKHGGETRMKRFGCLKQVDNFQGQAQVPETTVQRCQCNCDEDNISQARRYHGWLAQGIVHCNQLFNEIKEEHTKLSLLDLETYLMEEFQAEDEEKDGIWRKKCQK
jgi:hypothetical protein